MRQPVDWPTRDLLAHRAEATPDEDALIDAGSGDAASYARLDETVERLAGRLAGAGVTAGDHLGAVMATRPAFARLVHAAMRVGAVLVPVSARLTAPELTDRLDAADLDHLVCEAATAGTAAEAASPGLSIFSVDESDRAGIEPLSGVPDRELEPREWSRTDRQLLLFTSGTTGAPNAVALTAGNLAASAVASAFRLGVRPDDRWLVCLPMYHMGGLAPVVRSTLYGTAVVVQRGFDPDETARVLTERGATGVSLVPTMLDRLLDAGWTPTDDLRFVLLGGAPASAALLARCAERGVPACPTYGTTETASQVATARPEEATAYPGTVGRPLLFTDVTIRSPDGTTCEPGETGELVVDGPTVAPGYYGDETATEAAFGPRGFRTGDVGYRDAAGRLWVVGRLDDRIVTGGETVDPAEVADVLRSHPAVTDAAVVGLDDPEWGERVAALVVGEGTTAPALRRYAGDRLADFKRPKTIRFADALPRTASGTVDREAVAARLRE